MTPINEKTHKIIMATYHPTQHFFAVPIDWNMSDVYVKYGTVYYKNEEVNVKNQLIEGDYKRPYEVDVVDYDDYSHFLEE